MVESFATESTYDKLTIRGTDYSGPTSDGLTGVSVDTSTIIRWHSDSSEQAKGFRICLTPAPTSASASAAYTPGAHAAYNPANPPTAASTPMMTRLCTLFWDPDAYYKNK
eukprot:gene57043-biopygen107120